VRSLAVTSLRHPSSLYSRFRETERPKFLVYQGKYREFSGFGGVQRLGQRKFSRGVGQLRRNSLHKLTGNCFWHNRECIWRIREDIDQPMPFAMPKARAPTRSGWITLNRVLVVLTLIFWLCVWGVAGAILAVPMLAIAKIICDRIRPPDGPWPFPGTIV
jgi:hypothetical protein